MSGQRRPMLPPRKELPVLACKQIIIVQLRPMIRSAAICAVLSLPALLAQGNPEWHRPFPAFKIAGDLYYAGTADLAVYLVHTPQGNILINSNFEQDVPLIRTSIESLGFQYRDTKIVLIKIGRASCRERV